MYAQNSIVQTQEKFVINLAPQVARRVNFHDRQQLVRAYLKLYNGFSWVNWTDKNTLGRAWQMAFGQCESFLKNRNGKNLAAVYLTSVFASHKKHWSRVIMTHRDSMNKINPNDKNIQALRKRGMDMIRSAMDMINLILARYNEHAREVIKEQVLQAEPQQYSSPKKPAQLTEKAQPAQQLNAKQVNANTVQKNSPEQQQVTKLQQHAAQQANMHQQAQTNKVTPLEKFAPANAAGVRTVRPTANMAQKTRSDLSVPQKAIEPTIERHTKLNKLNTKPALKAAFEHGQQRVLVQALHLRIKVQSQIKMNMFNNANQRAA